MQSVKVTEAGFAVIGCVGELQTPVPAPDAVTLTVTEEALSDTTTVPPPKAADGLVRRIVRSEPLTVALTLGLLEAALSVPEAPESDTKAALEQSLRFTVVGVADNAPPVPHVPAPAPVPLTVIGIVVRPSETVTVAVVKAPEGVARLMERTLPVMETVTAPLSDAAV